MSDQSIFRWSHCFGLAEFRVCADLHPYPLAGGSGRTCLPTLNGRQRNAEPDAAHRKGLCFGVVHKESCDSVLLANDVVLQ